MWWCYTLIFMVILALGVTTVRTIVTSSAIFHNFQFSWRNKMFLSLNRKWLGVFFVTLFNNSRAMCTDHGQQHYFTALANNAYEKIKPLVHHTANYEFSFNFLHDPKNVIQQQVQLPLSMSCLGLFNSTKVDNKTCFYFGWIII